MQLGILAKTFPRPTLDETLDAIVAHGLTQVQFNMSCAGCPTLPDRLEEDFCIDIARALRERGLTMAAISGTFNMCDPDEASLEQNLGRLEILAAACRWLDTRIITLCTGTSDRNDMWRWHPESVRRSTWERLIQSMRAAVKIAESQHVTLAFEPEVNNVVNSVAKARMLLDEIGSERLKVVIDPVNLAPPAKVERLTALFDEVFDWLGGDIVLAHAKNVPGDYRIEDLGHPEYRRLLAAFVARSFQPHGSELTEVIEHGEHDPGEIALWGAFYSRYFQHLAKSNYTGAVIMHGMAENEVEKRLAYLQTAMTSVSS